MKRRDFLLINLVSGCSVLGSAPERLGRPPISAATCGRTATRPACQCGTLKHEPLLPYVGQAQTETYTLMLNRRVSMPDAFCLFCGGLPCGPWEESTPRCECGSLAAWAGNPTSAIQREEDVLESFVLKDERGALWPVSFCPACGGIAAGALIS